MQAALRQVHATLIEERAKSEPSRDSLVWLEDLTPPVESHAPMTLSTARALALSQRFDTGSLVPSAARTRNRPGLAAGATLLFIVGLGWAGRYLQRPTSAGAASTFPSTAPAGPGAAALGAVTLEPKRNEDPTSNPVDSTGSPPVVRRSASGQMRRNPEGELRVPLRTARRCRRSQPFRSRKQQHDWW